MSIGILARPAARSSAWRRVADYVELTKPRIAVMALVTVVVGSIAAGAGSVGAVLLAHTLCGTALLAAGASVFNQVLERDTDALMRRTRERPLPAGRIAVRHATLFGFATSLAGLVQLSVAVNPLTGLIGCVTLALYAFVYTPLKRFTSLNTVVGAIPGALPPVMGWTAVRGTLDAEAAILFLIVFLWQFPHFLAIAWLHREDYERAGLKMLPLVDGSGAMTGRQAVGYCLALLPASLGPTVVGLAGLGYFFGALWLGLVFLGFAVAFALIATQARARGLLRASLIYLPTLLLLMMLDLV